MGNFYSSTMANATTDDSASMEATRQRQRQHDLWIDGILVPPMFGIPSNPDGSTLSPSIILNTTTSPESLNYHHAPILGYVDYLRTQTDLSHRLLHTHLQPGLWITSKPTTCSTSSNIATSKTNVRVGIFDNTSAMSTTPSVAVSNRNAMNSMGNYPKYVASSSSSSLDDDTTTSNAGAKTLHQNQPSPGSIVGGQVTLERQFIHNRTGRNCGSIQFHIDPTNPQFAYNIHVTHRPIPSVSFFGTFLSSLSLSSSSSKPLSSNGYIGAQINHSIPLFSSSSSSNHCKTGSDTSSNMDGTTPYVIGTNPQHLDENEMSCKMGFYIPICWNRVLDALSDATIRNSSLAKRLSTKDPHLVPFYHNNNNKSNGVPIESWTSSLMSTTIANEINGCASMNILGATAAIQGSMPLSLLVSAEDGRHPTNDSYKTSSYFTTNINDETMNQSPIQLTIQQQNQFGGSDATTSNRSSISVSQMITFQRYQFNMFEAYSAPYIHNTLAWTIQMESVSETSSLTSSSTGVTAEDSGEHITNVPNGLNRTNRVSFGAVWQMNRNIALKAVVYPQSASFNNGNHVTATTAILLKRWHYPRITCSIIHRWDPMPKFTGIGIDIETGDGNNNVTTDDEMSFTTTPKSPPPTIAVLPKELYKLQRR